MIHSVNQWKDRPVSSPPGLHEEDLIIPSRRAAETHPNTKPAGKTEPSQLPARNAAPRSCVKDRISQHRAVACETPLGSAGSRREHSVFVMSDRFNCKNCNEPLGGRKYIQVEDKPHCIPCYDRLHANTCQECKEIIGHNDKELFYENRHYHAHCFRCFRCDRSLADEPFTSQGDALVCSDCYCNEFSSKCVACSKSVMPGSKMLEYDGSAWHEDCFTCHGCDKPIGAEAFIPDKGNYYCVPCYEGRFAPQCSHCKKALTKGGVTYKDEVWHKECFLCTGCKVPLAGQPFTSQGDSPYCVKCFSSLYAKKCAGCNTAITGFGDGKYISFEDRQWHQPCFKCSRCSVSLVGSGFFPDRGQILCTDCNNDD